MLILGAFITFFNPMPYRTRNFIKFTDAIKRLNKSQARLMDAQTTVMHNKQQCKKTSDHWQRICMLWTLSLLKPAFFLMWIIEPAYTSSNSPVRSPHTTETCDFHPSKLKLDVPHFDSIGPLGWIRPANSSNSVIPKLINTSKSLVFIWMLQPWGGSMDASKWPIKFVEWRTSVFETHFFPLTSYMKMLF